MGLLFVIIFQLIAIFFVGLFIGSIALAIATLWGKKDRRGKRLLFAFLSPFIAMYTFYFTALIGSITMSVVKNVDMGIGDFWYVPLSEECRLSFIDVSDYGTLSRGDETIIRNITQIQQIDDVVLGIADDEYFYYNLTTDSLRKYTSEGELAIHNPDVEIELKNNSDFYRSTTIELVGVWLITIGVISLLLSALAVMLFKRLIDGR